MALATVGGLSFGAESAAGSAIVSSRGSISTATLPQRPFINASLRANATLTSQKERLVAKYTASAAAAVPYDLQDSFAASSSGRNQRGPFGADVLATPSSSGRSGSLPPALYQLLDPTANVDLPPPYKINVKGLDNRELDKLFAALGRNKTTWRRALVLHEWLLGIGHIPDDRLCTTLIRVCSQHGQALTALNLYDWMRASRKEGGAELVPTVFTYTAAMRAALAGNLLDRAMRVWHDALASGCEPDGRMATTLIEVCARKGDTAQALAMYDCMRKSAPDSRMAPTVHAYTAAMRAAAEGGQWQRALDIWDDMRGAGCRATGHAFAAVISACAAGGAADRAVRLFDEMLELQIRPDVVSCTALITALGAVGHWERAERVVSWMLHNGIRPNVRTYTALVTAMGNARQWDRALDTIQRMKQPQPWGSVDPNAYTYSAILKTMGEQGQWQLAEALFDELEAECMGQQAGPSAPEPPRGPPQIWTAAIPGFGGAANAEAWAWGAETMAWQHAHRQQAAAQAQQHAMQQREQQGEAGERFDPLSHYGLEADAADKGLNNVADLAQSLPSLPSSIPGQSNLDEEPFSYFSSSTSPVTAPSPNSSSDGAASPAALPSSSASSSASASPSQQPPALDPWTASNAAVSGLQLRQHDALVDSSPARGAAASRQPQLPQTQQQRGAVPNPKVRGLLNEVVCGALMLAYERAGKWEQAVGMLDRSRRLGVQINTVMYNTALSALGKAGRWEAAEALFQEIERPDAVSYETLIAAFGIAGQAQKAEQAFHAMTEAGYVAKDYAYCGLIAAYSAAGNSREALRVPGRMKRAGLLLSVHVYNALIAACHRASLWDRGLALYREMTVEKGIEPNSVTQQLLYWVGQGGVAAVESQQAAAAALSAAVAAAGAFIVNRGLF